MGVCKSDIARYLHITFKAVNSKIKSIAHQARSLHGLFKEFLRGKIKIVEFDEMETYELSKLKPVSIAIAVVGKTSVILDAQAGEIRAEGKTVEDSVKKYGVRKNDRKCRLVFENLKSLCDENLELVTDKNRSYIDLKKVYLPKAFHKKIKSRGGEAKKAKVLNKSVKKQFKNRRAFDQLLHLNQSVCAKLRGRLASFRRRTWCNLNTVKSIQDVLDIFIAFNNRYQLFPD